MPLRRGSSVATHTAEPEPIAASPAFCWPASRAASHRSALSNDCSFVHLLSGAATSERCAPIHQVLVCGGAIKYQPTSARATAVCRRFNISPVPVKAIKRGSDQSKVAASVLPCSIGAASSGTRVFGSDKHQNMIFGSRTPKPAQHTDRDADRQIDFIIANRWVSILRNSAGPRLETTCSRATGFRGMLQTEGF